LALRSIWPCGSALGDLSNPFDNCITGLQQNTGEDHARTTLFGEAAGNALIEQEFYCSFSAVTPGAYYTVDMTLAKCEGRICEIDVTPGLPVHTAWDLGVDDPCAIWCFQVEPGRVNVVDYYENSGQGLKHYTDWLDARGYQGIDWLPHDARARELGDQVTPRTRVQNLIGLGSKPRICLHHTVMASTPAGRRSPAPGSMLDGAPEASNAFDSIKPSGARSFEHSSERPCITASYAADAWRVLAVSWREPMAVKDEEANASRCQGSPRVL
jgi:phage terminase large subunit